MMNLRYSPRPRKPSNSRNPRKSNERNHRAPQIEALEPRTLLAVFTVTNLDDSGAGSLRQAILDANATAEADEIQFQDGLSGTITLTSGELLIANPLTINGPGANLLSISGNNASRVFNVNDGDGGNQIDVTIEGLSLTGGKATGTFFPDVTGGAVLSRENLTISNSTITGNSADEVGGGIYNLNGTLTLNHSTVSGNTAGNSSGGGGIYASGTLTITNSTISGNSIPAATAGAYTVTAH